MSNDALTLTDAEGRRWSELHIAYARQLGNRFWDETVRIRLVTLINRTLMLERLQAADAEDANLIQATRTVMRLLAGLGLSAILRKGLN